MPTSDEDLEHRVTLLEQAVARLRQEAALIASDAGAARVLAGGADHDVADVKAELRAHRQLLNALRETQMEQGQGLDSLDGRVTDGFATIKTGMEQIVGMLSRITPDRPT